jgi:hypothetical protein
MKDMNAKYPAKEFLILTKIQKMKKIIKIIVNQLKSEKIHKFFKI